MNYEWRVSMQNNINLWQRLCCLTITLTIALRPFLLCRQAEGFVAIPSFNPETGTFVNQTIRYVGNLYEENRDSKVKYIYLGHLKIAEVRNGQVTYYHGDHLGSTNVITDESGNKKELVEYTPYGEAVTHDNIDEDDEVDQYFTGKTLDDETGYYYYGARYYDPSLGRFLTADSITPDEANPQALNRYSYVYNSPLNYIDPSGHFPWLALLGALIGGASAGISAYQNNGQFQIGNVALGALTGGIAGGTLGLSGAAAESFQPGLQILKASAATHLGAQISNAAQIEGVGRYLQTASFILGGAYTGFHAGLGIKDWIHEPRFRIVDSKKNILKPQPGDKVYVNGAVENFGSAINAARELGADKLAYNPTTSVFADFTEAALQKLTFTSSVDRQLANSLIGLEGISLVGYSQGSLITSNTLLNLGLRGHRNTFTSAKFLASPLTQPRAYLSAAISGIAKPFVAYETNYFDPINVLGASFHPVKMTSGAVGGATFFGFQKHSIYNYFDK